MIKLLLTICIIFIPLNEATTENRLGQSGHRATCYIAEKYLSEQAAEEVTRVLEGNSIAEVSNWMDEVRSDDAFNYMGPWHYCTIPEGKTYEEAGTPEEGDVLWAIEKVVTELKEGNLSAEQEAINLKVLIHLVGDLHQPLHAGNGTDRGGNDVRVTWFRDNSNLHRVWDSEMIDSKQMDGRELADFATNQLEASTIEKWQSTSWLDWAYESQSYHEQVYAIGDGDLSWRYMYKNYDTVILRIAQAGVRIAGLLNDIYG